MKKWKLAFCTLLACCLVMVLSTTVCADNTVSGYCGGEGDGTNLAWTLNLDTGELVISGQGAMKNYSSTSAPWYSYRSSMTSLTIESGLTSIGNYAFYSCSGFTGSLTIPDSVTTIGYDAFSGCSGFTGSLTIPDSVTTIGSAAFRGCSGFTGSLTIPDSVTTIGTYAFSGCSGFTGSLTIPDSVTTIGTYAFSGCSGFTGSLTIPNSVTTIGRGVFTGCSGFTGNLTIPANVTTIGDSAFRNCSGFTGGLMLPDGIVTIGEYAFYGCSGFSGNLTICDSVSTIGEYAFYGCSGFTGSLTIPAGVTTISNYAFDGCSGFTGDLTISNGITMIGNAAFHGCSGFTGSLTISSSVTTIGGSAFSGCSGFTGCLTIPGSITAIGSYAFYGCSGFTSNLTIPASVTTIGSCAFRDCSGFTGNLTIGDSVTTIGTNAFYNCSGFTGSLTIPDSVTMIGDYAFYCCSGFTGNLAIGDSVSTIGEYAFSDCSGFAGSLTIGNSVSTIGEYAFSGCSGFTGNLTIGDSVSTIGGYAFSDCSGFTGSLTIGDGVSTIGEYAFSGCSGFTGSLTIPVGITTISNNAFSDCSGFTGDLTIPNSITMIGNAAFSGCSGFTGGLTIPSSVTMIGGFAFSGCSGFTGSLTIPESVTAIGDYAFFRCSGFTGSLIICDGVSTIGKHAFYGCSGFTGNLTIPTSVTTIDSLAFYGCSGFTGSLTIPVSVMTIGSSAFSGCSGFTGSLIIPNSITMIGDAAFCGCSGFIDSLFIPEGVTTIGDSAFENCSGFTGSLTIPDGVITIGNNAFENCRGFTGSLTIPDSVTMIGNYAFYGCNGFTGSLNIPEIVTTIGRRAFCDCSGITSVSIPASVTSISTDAFYNCSNITNVYYNGNEEEWSNISISSGNSALTGAQIHYDSTGPGSDMTYGGIMFLTGWDNNTKTVIFADALINYSVTDKTDLSFLASWPDNCNSYVQVTADGAFNLISVEPVESYTGIVSAATANTLTIDGTKYYVAGKDPILLDDYVGQRVLYHLRDGVIVGVKQTVSMDASNYTIKTGGTGKIYIDFKMLPGETISYQFTSSDSSVISFSPEIENPLSMSCTATFSGAMEAYNGLRSADVFYALNPGTATITCTTSFGIQYTRTIVVQDEEIGTIISNNYNVPIYATEEDEEAWSAIWDLYADYEDAYKDFCEAYAKAVIEDAEEQGYDSTGGYTAQAEEMMKADANGELLTFIEPFDDSLKVYAYRALCQMIDEAGELKGVDFSSISFSDEFSLGSGIIKQVVSQIKTDNMTIPMGDVEVEIQCASFINSGNRFGVMKIRKVTSGATYLVELLPSEAAAEKAVEQYVAALQTLGEKAARNAYTTVVKELTGLSLSSMNEKMMSAALARLNSKFSEVVVKGFDAGEVLTALENCYDHYSACRKLATLTYSPTMANTTKLSLEKIANFDILNPVNFETTAATKNAAKKLSEVETRLINALEEYFYTGKISEETLGKISLNPFSWLWSGKCPIAVAVYDGSNNQIGYAGDDDFWYTDDILIEKNGEEIRVYSKEPVFVRVIGTDYGMMSFTVEEYADGQPLGRVNYYNIPLQENQTYTVSLANSSLGSTADVIMTDEEGTVIPAFEYIPVSMNAKVQIDAAASSDEVGTVIGDGNYVKGDLVTLTAYANDGYQFVGWFDGDDCVSISNTYAFPAYEDVSLTAQYIEVFPSFENYLVRVNEQYQDVYEVEVEQTDGVFTIHVTELTDVSAEGNVIVYFASYESDGKMGAIEVLQGQKTDTGLDFSGTVDDYGCKLFILDSNFCPITVACISE